MYEALTYQIMMEEISENARKYGILDDTIGILVTRPDLLTGKSILNSLEYFHFRTGTSFNLYLAGYGAYWPDSEYPDGEVVTVVDDVNWSFSNQKFVQFISELEKYSKWSYSGESELLLFELKKGILSYKNVMSFHLDNMIRDNVIQSIHLFFEQLFRICADKDSMIQIRNVLRNNKLKKIAVASIYALYSIVHLFIFQKLNNGSSYGTIKNEIQYLINYSFMIINLYLFYRVVQNKKKLKKSVFISFVIYVLLIFISIITKTSSSTYIEKIGYKGYFESGNSLCTVLILSIAIILSEFTKKQWKEAIFVVSAGVYLTVFSGMRTGLFGFGLIILIFAFIKILELLKTKLSKVKIILGVILILTFGILISIFGAKTLERRKMLKEQEASNIDNETGEKRYVTGDILELYKKILKQEVDETYMSKPEQNAIVDLCEYAKKIKLSNVNLRKQQLIYNVYLVKEQKNIGLILFGNGYKNQTGELVMEMEIPAFLINFGVFGFILYFGPFLAILIYALKKSFKKLNLENAMYLTGIGLAMGLATLSGYVYFSFSSMTMVIILNVLLLKNIEKEQVVKKVG